MTDEETKVDTRSIWLTVLRGGGRWHAAEIATELGCVPDDVHRLIAMMAVRGYVRRHQTEGKRLQYSVDRSCKIPVGLSIGEVMEAPTA